MQPGLQNPVSHDEQAGLLSLCAWCQMTDNFGHAFEVAMILVMALAAIGIVLVVMEIF